MSWGNMARFNSMDDAGGSDENAQETAVKSAELKLAAASWCDEMESIEEGGATITNHDILDYTVSWNWTAGKGGSYKETSVSTPLDYDGSIGTSEDDAPIMADGSVPYVHHTDSLGDDDFYAFSGSGAWQRDFS